ncbi:MAG: sigma 54-interacting transcriptional regulator [Deltaproteobacteria bacterium]|nr:sigma 54-interacting transcriptional regulator [Deltaproteobacteria bacterium]MBN2673730.1 sigma 54-interacting transcriptional regulator [Deltaproteobacteria bacterium]
MKNYRTGIIINRRYRIERHLGDGAQGEVYQAYDLIASAPRALKMCSSSTPLSLEGEFFKLFELQHPNLARVYDFQLVNDVPDGCSIRKGTVFFTEELVKGKHAETYIQALEPSERVSAVAQIGIGVARALRMLHSRGILHLDVKPSNIIVDSTGHPRLIDLGLARSRDRAAGVKAGTLGYMGKEVFDGLADDGTDIFALGQVLIQLLSGKAPSIQLDAVIAVPSIVPEPFAAVLQRMTDEQLDKRYSARETVLAIVKSGVVRGETTSEYLDDASDADDARSRFAIARSTRFVGREQQLAQLRTYFDEAFQRRGASVCVVHGPIGVGKTRLVRKGVASLQVMQAQRGGESITFLSGTIRAIAENILNISSAEDAAPIKTWLHHDTELQQHLSPSDNDTYVSEKIMGRLLSALAQRSGPAVVLVEDANESLVTSGVHWAQETLGTIAHHLALVFELSQLEFSPAMYEELQIIELGPLSSCQETEMIEGITGTAQDAQTMAQFHRRTGGNPRFVEILLEQFIKSGATGRLDIRQLERIQVEAPERMLADKLLSTASNHDAELLSLLAIAQTSVSVEELRNAMRWDADEVVTARFSIRMIRAGYVHAEQGKLVLIPLVSKGVVALLSGEDREKLHCKLLRGLNPSRSAEQLGMHAFYAKQYDVAAVYLRSAGDDAIRAGNMVRAISCLEMLRSCNVHNESELLLELAICYRRSGKYDDALQLTQVLLTTTSSEKVQLEHAATRRLQGDWKQARQILGTLTQSGDDLVRYTALSLLARIHLDNGEVTEGIRLLEPLTFDEELAHQSGMVNVMGLLHLTSGKVTEARQMFEIGLRVVKGKSPIEEARYYSYLGMVAHAQENWWEAARHYEVGFWLADEFGDNHGAATYVVNWAAALTELGDVTHALLRYRNGMNRLRLVGRPEELMQTEANYAQLLLRLGDVTGALKVTENALSVGPKDGNPFVFGNALTVRGEALVAGNEWAEAVHVLKQAQRIFEQKGQGARKDYCRLHLAAAYLHQGKVEQASEQVELVRDDAVISEVEYLAMGVQLALQGKGNVRYEVDQLLLAFPDNATSYLGLEHFKAMCVAVLALVQLRETKRWIMLLRVALDLLQRIRERTPALHRPEKYPYERQMRELQTQGSELMTNITEENSEEMLMKHLWLERLMRITARLNSELNVDAQLDIIMDTAVDVTDAERGFLLIRDDNGVFSIRSARNMDSEALLKQERNYSSTIARRAFEQGEPIVTTNAQEDEQFREYRSVATLNLMYIVAVPLLVKGNAQGTIYLDSTTNGRFDSDRIELLKMLANQAAIALTNAKLVSRVKSNREKIERLNNQLTSRLALTEKELEQTRRDLREINENLASKYNFYGIIGGAKPMTEMFRVLERIASTDIPVVIGGESGTGKELVAKAIHCAGGRKDKPFIAENCAAIPSQLLESILFGHVRGAFTGAVSNRNGLFAEAHGGTLFLDEIGDMPLEMQSKLLRVLQDGEVRPVGQNQSIKVDVRILVATNADLKKLVEEGKFREDLFYRLHVMEVCLPPLRDRREDIPVLADYFVKKHAPKRTIEISREALEQLMNYRWPGNVRQLENEMIRATVMCGSFLDVEHLSEGVRDFSMAGFEEGDTLVLEHHVNRLKKQLIKTALRKSRGNRSKASEMLGISRYGLQKMMARLEMNDG